MTTIEFNSEAELDQKVHELLGRRSCIITDEDLKIIIEKCNINCSVEEAINILGDPDDQTWADDAAAAVIKSIRDRLLDATGDTIPSVPIMAIGNGENPDLHDFCPECGEKRTFPFSQFLAAEDIVCQNCGHVSKVTVRRIHPPSSEE